MSYFTLPKTNNNIMINLTLNVNNPLIYTSQSLYFHYNDLYQQLQKICEMKDNLIESDDLLKLINPYEYIYSNVPGSKFSVSKLKPKSSLFYDLLEILNNSFLFEQYKNENITNLYVTVNYIDVIYCNELIRENNSDDAYFFETIDEDFYKKINNKKFDFIFFEINKSVAEDPNLYILKLLDFFKNILICQNKNGTCIIKINTLFYKPVIDIIYLLSSIYEKTNLVKPTTSNVSSFEKYIVCKNFILNENKTESYNIYCKIINDFIHSYNGSLNIASIINTEIPCYFLNKIDDINIILGQQQLEAINQIINIFKNKNKEDKFEIIKKTNIQKSVTWCEKFKIPCNKFSEKINIFLPTSKEFSVENA